MDWIASFIKGTPLTDVFFFVALIYVFPETLGAKFILIYVWKNDN